MVLSPLIIVLLFLKLSLNKFLKAQATSLSFFVFTIFIICHKRSHYFKYILVLYRKLCYKLCNKKQKERKSCNEKA